MKMDPMDEMKTDPMEMKMDPMEMETNENGPDGKNQTE